MEARTTSPRRSFRPSARVLLTLLGAFLVLVVIAWGALVVLFPPTRVRTLVSRQFSRALSRDARFDDAALTLWPPVRLEVRGPAVAEPDGFGKGAAFQARSVNLDLDLLPLFRRRIVVRRIEIVEPAVHLVFRADGTTNLDGIVKPEAKDPRAGTPMDLDVRELSVVRGRVLADDLKARRRTAFEVETHTDFSSRAGGTRLATAGSTTLSKLAFGPLEAARMSDLNQSLAKLEAKLEHRGTYDANRERLALERLDVRLGQAKVRLFGVLDEPGPRARLDLKTIGTRLDLGELLGYLSAADSKALAGIHGDGRVEFDLGVRGALGRGRMPSLIGTLTVADGSFRYPGAPAGVEDVAFTANFARDSIGVGDLRARVSDQPVQGALTVTRLADPMVRFALRGNVDLAAIAPLVADKDTRLAGRAAVDVRGGGRAKDPGSFVLDGHAQLADVSVQSPTLPKRVEKVNGAIRFSQARASVSRLTAQAGKSSFTVEADVARPLALLAKPGRVDPAILDFRLVSNYLDLAELLPATPGTPFAPNARGTGHVSIARLIRGKLDVADVDARVELEPAVVVVPQYRLTGYSGHISGSGRFDLHDATQPVYSVKANVDSADANQLLSAWTPAKNLVQGTLDLAIDFSGEGTALDQLKRTLTAKGTAEFLRGQLGPGPVLETIARFTRIPSLAAVRFEDLKMPFRVERGRVVTDQVSLRGSYGEWHLAGAIGFDGSLDYAVSITLPREIADRLKAQAAVAAGALADEKGDLLLDLRVRGTAKSPQVAWDSKAMRDRLLGKASQALTDKRDELEREVRDAAEARRKAAEDSLRAEVRRRQQAIRDSLAKRARDVLGGFFGGGRDTGGRVDTTARP